RENDMAIRSLPIYLAIQSNIPQRTAARHALQHYVNANIILVNMLEQCRYLHIPLGNFPDDPCLFVCDLFYARHLIKHNHLLWCSLTDQPDLG
ncbi:unnamed protein product, partial [Rotaria sp. Silwood2]